MLLYYITDRAQFPGNEVSRRRLLLRQVSAAVACGVDFIQLRERDLPTRELEDLASEVLRRMGETDPRGKTALLVNSRSDVAISCAADGVHLRSDDVSPRGVRDAWSYPADARERPTPIIGISCHTPAEVERAKAEGADFAVFGPVFEKKDRTDSAPPHLSGLDRLRQACLHPLPVLALGGIALENARACVEAGAAGIAAIRLFQEDEIADNVRRLRD